MKNKDLIDRFLRYVKIDTQSAEDAEGQPSTAKQRNLAALLAEELRELGAEVDYDEEHCYVYAKLPGTEPALGFIAHMDTSPEASGKDVKPRVFTYKGDDSLLSEDDFPELAEHRGEELIATDGTTLLGADDKAGVAEIMNLVQYYAEHPKKAHRTICVAFTPDEEIGSGTLNFDPGRFTAEEAYTVDGGEEGEIAYETFNACSAHVEFAGLSVHPGSSKDTMINAALVAMEFNSLLPAADTPRLTEDHEGFFHLTDMKGDVEHATLSYIIRDHDRAMFEHRKQMMRHAQKTINERYGQQVVTLAMKDSYYNMAEILKDHMHLVDNAMRAAELAGMKPYTEPVRGGTDGARLSYMGLPTPNLCTGGAAFHGRFEHIAVESMDRCTRMIELLMTSVR